MISIQKFASCWSLEKGKNTLGSEFHAGTLENRSWTVSFKEQIRGMPWHCIAGTTLRRDLVVRMQHLNSKYDRLRGNRGAHRPTDGQKHCRGSGVEAKGADGFKEHTTLRRWCGQRGWEAVVGAFEPSKETHGRDHQDSCVHKWLVLRDKDLCNVAYFQLLVLRQSGGSQSNTLNQLEMKNETILKSQPLQR